MLHGASRFYRLVHAHRPAGEVAGDKHLLRRLGPTRLPPELGAGRHQPLMVKLTLACAKLRFSFGCVLPDEGGKPMGMLTWSSRETGSQGDVVHVPSMMYLYCASTSHRQVCIDGGRHQKGLHVHAST